MNMLRFEKRMRELGSTLVGSTLVHKESSYLVVRTQMKYGEVFLRKIGEKGPEISLNMHNWTILTGSVSQLAKRISWAIT